MSTEAAYIRATQSSHLLWRPTIGDVDRLVAAGKVEETLAIRLIRLRAEFDSVAKSRALIPALRGFRPTHQALMSHAIAEASRRNVKVDASEACAVASKVLDIFLDPNCPICDGRGVVGQYGSPQLLCTTCGGSKARRAWFRTDAEEHFAGRLETTLAIKMANALSEMRRMLVA